VFTFYLLNKILTSTAVFIIGEKCFLSSKSAY